VRLFLTLNADVNEHLRARMRYHGELSRYIDEALTATDLGQVDLIPPRPGKRTPGPHSRDFPLGRTYRERRPGGEVYDSGKLHAGPLQRESVDPAADRDHGGHDRDHAIVCDAGRFRLDAAFAGPADHRDSAHGAATAERHITSPTTTSFTVVLNGFSTTRALTQLDVQITPQPGVNISAAHLTVDVNTAAASWYQSTASQTAGGSFLAAIPFVLQNGSSTDDLVHRLQSLSITATNSAGVSSSVTVPIR
jgi:hypothetical protein